jgi:hypothetical protein
MQTKICTDAGLKVSKHGVRLWDGNPLLKVFQGGPFH